MVKISIIEVKELTKIFNGDIRAVDGISFTVEKGEIFGFLGPNGAGKTTTLNMLATLLKPTSGTATVNGFDILKDPDGVRKSIGFVFQDPTLDIELTGRENLDFHGRIYGLKSDVRKQRIEEMLKVVKLNDRADDFVKTYSGGMKRRLEIARGLLHHPKVLFLDEPTLGLDPQTRRSIWAHIQRLNEEEEVTIILTTHYTEEADYLCNRILIIDFGKIVALDTPESLKAQLKGDVVSLIFKDSSASSKIRLLLENQNWVIHIHVLPDHDNQTTGSRMANMMRGTTFDTGNMGGTNVHGPINHKSGKHPHGTQLHGRTDQQGSPEHFTVSRRLNLLVDDGGRRIPNIVKLADQVGVTLESVELHKPTLDDVFIATTGRNIRDEQGSFIEMIRRFRIMRQARGKPVHS